MGMGYMMTSLTSRFLASGSRAQVKRGGVNIQQLHSIANPWQPPGCLAWYLEGIGSCTGGGALVESKSIGHL